MPFHFEPPEWFGWTGLRCNSVGMRIQIGYEFRESIKGYGVAVDQG